MAEITQERFNQLMNNWADTDAGKDSLRDALYPLIARGDLDGNLDRFKDSVRNAVGQGRFLRGGELPSKDGSFDFSPPHYMDSQRHIARELRNVAVKVGADLDAPGNDATTIPGAISPEPAGGSV